MALNFVILALIAIATLVYYYFRTKFSYWKVRGVPHMKPDVPFGSMWGVGTKCSFAETWLRHYKYLKGKGPIGGVYFFTAPSAMVLDLDLMRNILVKDFQHFQGRGMYVNERDDPLTAHLFNMEGAKWKSLRAQLSPTFTTGKMKMMHSTFLAVVDQFRDHLNDLSGGKKVEVDLKELLAQFTTDVIGSAAFGVECNSMTDPDSEFRRYGKKVFENTPLKVMKMIVLLNFPNFSRALGLLFTPPEVTKFVMRLLADTVKHRDESKVKRNDFLQLLLQIKNTGKLEGEDTDLGKMTFNELAAQVFLFFIAGFETSSSTMTFAFYELAMNPDLQAKAREEVIEVLGRYDGLLSYEAAMELTYIDQIIHETLRKYPIFDTLLRTVTIPYKVPNTDLVLEKGLQLLIPVMGIQRDPDFYPDPEKFDPERFTKENVAARHPYAWMPFGQGPRNCVGMRFGMMQARLGIAMILKSFMVTPSEKTPMPLVLDPVGALLIPKGGMFFNIEPVQG